MSLPVIDGRSAASPADLLRLFYRTEVRWREHLAEPAALDVATAFANPELPEVYDANHVLDVALPAGVSPRQAVEQVEQHFAQARTPCYQWMMNPSAPEDQVGPMVAHLLELGYRASGTDVLYLRNMPLAKVVEVGGLTIIPARASYRHTEAILSDQVRGYGPQVAPQLTQAGLRHLDDPHYEALLALKDGEPVAYVGVLSVGELGRIEPLFVAETFRRQGIGRTMMSRALEVCARALFRHVFVSVMPDNAPAQALYARLGFERIGVMTVYQRATGSAE